MEQFFLPSKKPSLKLDGLVSGPHFTFLFSHLSTKEAGGRCLVAHICISSHFRNPRVHKMSIRNWQLRHGTCKFF